MIVGLDHIEIELCASVMCKKKSNYDTSWLTDAEAADVSHHAHDLCRR